MPSPEELARDNIDKLLTQCGWKVQGRKSINLSADRGVAVREALLKGGDEADYLLFVDGRRLRSASRFLDRGCCPHAPTLHNGFCAGGNRN